MAIAQVRDWRSAPAVPGQRWELVYLSDDPGGEVSREQRRLFRSTLEARPGVRVTEVDERNIAAGVLRARVLILESGTLGVKLGSLVYPGTITWSLENVFRVTHDEASGLEVTALRLLEDGQELTDEALKAAATTQEKIQERAPEVAQTLGGILGSRVLWLVGGVVGVLLLLALANVVLD